FGTIVTGTARSGQIRDGEEVEIQPAGVRARVRSVQVHGASVSSAAAGQRTALNLAGIERDDLARGMSVVRPGTIPPTSILDARYHHLAAAVPIEHGARVRLLAGTTEVMGVLSVLDDDALQPGGSHLIQLRTDVPVVMLPHDRFILRRESPLETLGGGTVLDPWSRRARRKHHARSIEQLSAIEAGDLRVHLARGGEAGLSPAAAARYGIEAAEAVVLGGCWLHPEQTDALEATLMEQVRAWHAANPLVPGVPRRDLRRGIFSRLPESLFVALVDRLAGKGLLVLEGPRLRAADFQIRLSATQQATRDALEETIRAAGFEGPKTVDVLKEHPELLHLLQEAGSVDRVGPYLMHSQMLSQVRASVSAWLSAHGALLPADFKEMTGLSRKYAIPLLEWLDGQGVTRRMGDRRVAP
ncbi:MAG: selenocysteine-specific elongation factor, partial [Myxococcota bacterium]